MRSPRPILLRIGSRLGGRRGSGSENRVRYVHLLARRGRERAAVPRKQINAPRSNINSIIETKRAGGVAGRSLLARRGCSGGTWLPRRMRVDVSAGLRRMNEGRRVMLPRYCTARHERTSKGRGRGGWLPVPPPASFRPRAIQLFDPLPRRPRENSAVDAVLCASQGPKLLDTRVYVHLRYRTRTRDSFLSRRELPCLCFRSRWRCNGVSELKRPTRSGNPQRSCRYRMYEI